MDIFIDTNVIIDFIACRHPFYQSAKRIIELCACNECNGFISIHSVIDTFYILRKQISVKDRKLALSKLCKILNVVSVDKTSVLNVLNDESVIDIEDEIQIRSAIVCNAKCIVTRNVSDFQKSTIPAISSLDFLERFNFQ